MQRIVQISTPVHNGPFNITRQVESIVSESGINTGTVNVYAQGATAAVMILFCLMYPLFVIQRVILGYNKIITVQ
jgi:hypothetical protein